MLRKRSSLRIVSCNICIVLVAQGINASAEGTGFDIRYRPVFCPYEFIDSFFLFTKPNNLILKHYSNHLKDNSITSTKFARF